MFFSYTLVRESGCQLLEDSFIHSDARVEILQREIFVGRMGPAIRQSQSEQKRLDAENIPELGDDRDAATFANDRDVRIESFAQSALRSLALRRMRVGQIPRPAVAVGQLDRDTGRQIFAQMLLGQLQNFFALLIRDQSKS